MPVFKVGLDLGTVNVVVMPGVALFTLEREKWAAIGITDTDAPLDKPQQIRIIEELLRLPDPAVRKYLQFVPWDCWVTYHDQGRPFAHDDVNVQRILSVVHMNV